MKTRTLFAIIVLVINHSLSAQNYDFRNSKWGMDSVQVKKTEESTLIQSKKNRLMYKGKLGDLEVKIIYYFTLADKLFDATYFVTLDSKNPQNYVNTFIMLQELLSKKYNKPYEIKTSTVNGKVITSTDWASHLISDNLTLETKWKTDKTVITLSLFSINDELCTEINYESREIDNNLEQRTQIIKDL